MNIKPLAHINDSWFSTYLHDVSLLSQLWSVTTLNSEQSAYQTRNTLTFTYSVYEALAQSTSIYTHTLVPAIK
jgi:hypothetical protein